MQGTPNPFVLDSILARRAFKLSANGVASTASATLSVNEIHFDNAGDDVDERIELAGLSGTRLAGWSLVFDNGSGGSVYNTTALHGTIPNQQGGSGTMCVPVRGLQNGAADGITLVSPFAPVVHFLSYEGTLTAGSGTASGQTSEDVGVAESSTMPVGHTLQLLGSGTAFL